MKNNSKSQALVLVLMIVTIFASIVVTIAALTARELEMREVDEMALDAGYASETAWESAQEVIGRGYALKFDGANDYVRIPNGPVLFSGGSGPLGDHWDQFTIEIRFKVDSLSDLKSGKFHILTASGGTTAESLREGTIAMAGPDTSSLCTPYACCPNHLVFRYYYGVEGWGGHYAWFPLAPDPSNCNSGWEIKPGKWYYFAITNVQAHNGLFPYSTWFPWINEQPYYINSGIYPQIYYQAGARDDTTVYDFNIGKSTTSEAQYDYFKGAIDEVRLYKHHYYQLLTNPPAFWPNDGTAGNQPNDIYNHYKGIYDYDSVDDYGSSHPGSFSLCAPYDPQNPTNSGCPLSKELVLYQKFNEGNNTCLYQNTEACIEGDSPGGLYDGIPSGFQESDSSGWYMPAAPGSKESVSMPLTGVKNVIHVDKDSIGGTCGVDQETDCNPMDNEYSYSFDIIPYRRDINSNSCSCSPAASGCCCHNYCINTSGKSP